MKAKRIILTLAALLVGSVAFAVFNEKNISQTLSVLRGELKEQNDKMERAKKRIRTRNDDQHGSMVDMVKKSNELSLILYSQNQDYTFDVTYALQQATKEYDEFNKRRMPFDEIITRLDLDIDRYERLIESLRRLPPVLEELSDVPDSIAISTDTLRMQSRPAAPAAPGPKDDGTSALPEDQVLAPNQGPDTTDHSPFVLDGQSQIDRDSCLVYAQNLLSMYKAAKERITADSLHYSETSARLQETYDYAQNRYKSLQKTIFVDGQDNYFRVLKHLPSYSKRAFEEARQKYSSKFGDFTARGSSEWRGPVVTGFILYVFFYLIVSFLLGMLLVKLLFKFVKRFQTEEFAHRKSAMTLLAGVLIFAISIMLANQFINQNFFIEASGLLLVYAWMLIAIVLSLIIHLDPDRIKDGFSLYIPIIVLGLIVITLRIIFIPNRFVNLILTPLLIVFFIWQWRLTRRKSRYIKATDIAYSGTTLFFMGVALIMSVMGYVLMSIQLLIWWLFQLTALMTLTAIADILKIYEIDYLHKHIKSRLLEIKLQEPEFQKLECSEELEELRKRIEEEQLTNEEKAEISTRIESLTGRIAALDKKIESINSKPVELDKKDLKNGEYIEYTWSFDLIKMAVVPVLTVLSIPFCIFMAAKIFDLTALCKTIFTQNFFDIVDSNGNTILKLSLYRIFLVTALFFVFRYICYLLRALYKKLKYRQVQKEKNRKKVRANEVNLTLANNLIGIVVWLAYIIMFIMIFKIPMGALSIVAAGLATGLGLAMKDILNNFIYGIQLMAGRLRVGDKVECDGVRGKVANISYQSTEIEAEDGSLIAFTNTTLFNKNFKNLTINTPYEYAAIMVGVSYGTDIEFARKVLLEALEEVKGKDSYGRNIIRPDYGIKLTLNDFGDNSINLKIKQFVIVEEKYSVLAKEYEIIYKTLNENGISIPFPQRDLHIIKDGE